MHDLHMLKTQNTKSYLLSCLTPSTQHRSAVLSLLVRLRLRRRGNEHCSCSSDMVLLRRAVHATQGRGGKFHGAASATDKGSLFIKGINKQGRENDMSTLYWHNAPPAPPPHLSPPWRSSHYNSSAVLSPKCQMEKRSQTNLKVQWRARRERDPQFTTHISL